MQLNSDSPSTFMLAHFLIAHFGVVLPASSVDSVPTANQCRTNDDCDSSLGQQCYWLYDGCHVGQCMCNPKRHRQEPTGYCTPIKYGNERCSGITDVCLEGMSCMDGYCRCTAGSMTPDGLYCLRSSQRLLGQKCWQSSNTNPCLHKSVTGYTRYDVRCSSRGECECDDGYKADRLTCRRWNMKEFGCTSTFHCQGGAICEDGQCLCPRGYVAVAGNSKCAKRGAITDLPSGATCDEINESRYCAHSLVCHKCPDEEDFKCVSFLMVSEYAYLGSSSSASDTSSRRFQINGLISFCILFVLASSIPFYIHR